MKRRKFILNTLGAGIMALPASTLIAGSLLDPKMKTMMQLPVGPARPLTIYDNWSAYDELSDNIFLTEELAMKELNELLRLKRNGVKFDYYVMDAFWFDKSGGYRTWHKQHWPNGPDAWLRACKENNIKPGLWISTNLISTHSGPFLDVIPEWKDSVSKEGTTMCLFTGGYLRHLAETLQFWIDKGVKAFKFDFAYFGAATEEIKKKYSSSEIEEKNKLTFMNMLKKLRHDNQDILLTGYNGLGGDMDNTFTEFRKTVDPRWLEVFDTLYCGDPRFSDVPAMNIWRSQDIYSDHMTRQFEFNGLPLNRIDNCAFMIGKTGTCYSRGINAWKGMLILSLARGGWANIYHGNLELLNDTDAQWFAKTQQMYNRLQGYNTTSTFGEIPGKGKPYGFKSKSEAGTLFTMVNPSQTIAGIDIPLENIIPGRILYHDSGFLPVLNGAQLKIGAEQLVVVGFGEFANDRYDLGVDDSVKIPVSIEKVIVQFNKTGKNSILGKMNAQVKKDIRIFFQQFGKDNYPRRSWGGAPPNGKKMDEFMKIIVMQGDKIIPVTIEYNKMIWSGLSWAAGEIRQSSFDPDKPLSIQCMSSESEDLKLQASVYAVTY